MKAEEALGAAIDYVSKTIYGEGALKGQDGFSPIIAENVNNTEDDYRLDITTAYSTFTTENLVGKQGEEGKDGITYTPIVGKVETVESSSAANVEIEIDKESKTAKYSFFIPKGEKGDQGDKCEQDNYLSENNAGVHNSIYRGKYLGNTVTDEQYAFISDGTFEDLYIGDYWTIGDVNYRIAAFDYYLNCGDKNCTTHHVVIVPDSYFYNYMANYNDDLNAKGYVGSRIYTSGLENAKSIIKSAFSGHVLSHRLYLTNAFSDGIPSACAWCDSEVDLMCEEMVFGTGIFRPTSIGTSISRNERVEKSQLPLFTHEPSRIGIRWTWWLRDVASSSSFSTVNLYGDASYSANQLSLGVRPAFCIS